MLSIHHAAPRALRSPQPLASIPSAPARMSLRAIHEAGKRARGATSSCANPRDGAAPPIHPSKRTHTELVTDRRGKLPRITFHGCHLPPSRVFAKGLDALHRIAHDPEDPEKWRLALSDHAWGELDGPSIARQAHRDWLGCAFVGTSKSVAVAEQFTTLVRHIPPPYDPHVFEVDLRVVQQLGIPVDDVNKALGEDSPQPWEDEVRILNHVPPEAIVRAYPHPRFEDLGSPIENPNYRNPDLPEGGR